MKCPHCSADLNGKDICGTCGRKIEQAPEIEVEYKDFKLSEYLEIRRKEHKTSSGTEADAQKDGRPRSMRATDEKAEENTRGRTPAEGDQVRRTPASRSLKEKRSSSLVAAMILLLLAALAGALYLWRFLAR